MLAECHKIFSRKFDEYQICILIYQPSIQRFIIIVPRIYISYLCTNQYVIKVSAPHKILKILCDLPIRTFIHIYYIFLVQLRIFFVKQTLLSSKVTLSIGCLMKQASYLGLPVGQMAQFGINFFLDLLSRRVHPYANTKITE